MVKVQFYRCDNDSLHGKKSVVTYQAPLEIYGCVHCIIYFALYYGTDTWWCVCECTGRARIVRQEGHRSSNVIDQVCWNDPNPVCFYWFPKYFPLFCLTKQLNNASSISLCNDRARIVRQGGQRSHNIIDQICCNDSNPFCFYWFRVWVCFIR